MPVCDLEQVAGRGSGQNSEKPEEPEKEEEPGIDIEAKPEITIDEFAKLQFQVGQIIACEAVKKSKKLLCSQVKIGSQVRQIVSGIKAALLTGGDGRQEGHGCDQLEAGKAGRSPFGRHDPLRRGCRRKSGTDDAGEGDARRSRDLLKQGNEKMPVTGGAFPAFQ